MSLDLAWRGSILIYLVYDGYFWPDIQDYSGIQYRSGNV